MPPRSFSLSSSLKRFIALLTVVIAAFTSMFYIIRTQPQPAPNVVFTTLTGERAPLNALRGKVLLVNFWATSCAVCVREVPQMVRTYNRFKARGLEIVAIAMSYDPPNYVLNYAQTRQLPYAVVLDPQDELAQAFGVRVAPTTFLIGKDGNIIVRFQGELEFSALDELLDKALTASG